MVRFIALSGTTGVTENLNVYEYKDEMFILDCGVGFPDLEMPGVDLVIPDFSYVVKNKHKLKAIVLSQGHEDHIGALPFLLKQVNAPIYCAPLVAEFLKEKFRDNRITDFKINTFNSDMDTFQIGSFKISPFKVTHSVPDTVGFAIETPEGKIMHVPEHKIDQESVDGHSFDLDRARKLAEGNVICLISDCLGSNEPGFAPSAVPVEERILNIAKNAKNALFMSAMSSSIGRFQQMINVAVKLNRKVVFVGRSIQQKTESAHKLGYLKYLDSQVVDLKKAKRMHPKDLLYIVAGCYGQVGSSVYRLATDDDDRFSISDGDMFIFSANPAPPYSKESQDFIIDELIDRGVDVHYYDLKEGLHVSGHGGQEDIKMLFDIAKPKYFIPTGGTIKHMHSYEKLVVSTGKQKSQVFKLKPGDSIEFENGTARRGQKVKVKEVMVHGLGIGDIGKTVLEHRTLLGKQGMAVVVFKATKSGKVLGNPEIVTKGFVFEGISGGLLNDAMQRLMKHLKTHSNLNSKKIKEDAIKFLEGYFFKTTGRSPMIIPIVVEV
ncbi:MAG: ribonuclease J [bacterium]|nr:MAG: ribonuclease J [bacterium]